MVVYHTVNDQVPDHIRHLYQPRSVSRFSDDMNFLLKHYQPIDLLRLKKMVINREKPGKNRFFVSFDDGLSEFYFCAAPLLKRLGIPATCFLNTAFIDNRDMFYRYKVSVLIEEIQKHKEKKEFWQQFHKLKESHGIPQGYYRSVLLSLDHSSIAFIGEAAKMIGLDFKNYLKVKKPYLTSDQISDLVQQGFTFGGHSTDHTEFSRLSATEQINQALQSTRIVVEKFGLSYKIFSFPFTDFGIGKAFFDAIFTDGQVDLSFGAAGLKHDSVMRNLQRIPMEDFNLSAERRLKTDYFYYLVKSVIGKNTIIRKQ